MTGAMPVTPGHQPGHFTADCSHGARDGAGGKVVGCRSFRETGEKLVEALPSPCLDQDQMVLPTPAPCWARPRLLRVQGAGARCRGQVGGCAGAAGDVGCFCRGLGIATSPLHPPAAVMAFPTQPHCRSPPAPHHAAVTCQELFLNRPKSFP